MGKFVDLTGQRFGELLVVRRDQSKVGNRAGSSWLCQCSCGNPVLKSVFANHLKSGHTKTCGKCIQFNMINKKFSRLTPLELDKETSAKMGRLYYHCCCECGKQVSVDGYKLRSGHTRSCGCLSSELAAQRNLIDLTNQRFGQLQVISLTGEKDNNGSFLWLCKCDCGNETVVSSASLRQGKTHSCGCLQSIGEAAIQKILTINGIEFEKEKTFADLISDKKRPYRYDFYLPKYNRLVEFDGEQHYKVNEHFGGESYLKRVQDADKIKNEYALAHGISLVRIPYTERDSLTLEKLLGDNFLITGGEKE